MYTHCSNNDVMILLEIFMFLLRQYYAVPIGRAYFSTIPFSYEMVQKSVSERIEKKTYFELTENYFVRNMICFIIKV